ncbi:hypothetical protein JJ685_12235 [Ramlibacter monticola]|uniref:Uncharacterized protein n=2 Tax=Ramlibacter monticola TaxID=1926872 RepID=A0A936YZ45_9BURK|nr:hypothetical protein [Ramlibacter monticola]MBL0391899.1 hypothetical protein [Ramlibacter monticola]
MTIYVEKTAPEARQRKPPEGIQGWGADLDPQARPAYPKERTPPRFIHRHWDELEQQEPSVKVFHSTERPGLTPVFGTAQPPSGLSGMLRAGAFRYSENDLRHWLMLLFADRVNVVEGILDDLAHGHVPNLFREMGGPAEWRHNRAGFVRKAAIAAGVVALLLYVNGRRRRR